MKKMQMAQYLHQILVSVEACRGADDFYEKHRTNALREIDTFFAALESEPEPQEEIKALRAALLYEWKYNHAEHCGNTLPCPRDVCKWPMPKILEES